MAFLPDSWCKLLDIGSILGPNWIASDIPAAVAFSVLIIILAMVGLSLFGRKDEKTAVGFPLGPA